MDVHACRELLDRTIDRRLAQPKGGAVQ